jgi:hypothetical protein
MQFIPAFLLVSRFHAVPIQETEGYDAMQDYMYILIMECAWAIIGCLGGLLWNKVNPPQTKSGGRIPRHMAQFAIIIWLGI